MSYPKEQFWKIYRNLPEELQAAISSPQNSETIYEIVKENEIIDRLVEISDIVADVLMGYCAPEKFGDSLVKNLKIEKVAAKKIFLAINQQIFSKVQQPLARLYEKKQGETTRVKIQPQPAEEKIVAAPQTKITERRDVYRESI